MLPSIRRHVRLGLAAVVVSLIGLFAITSANGQPPRPPFGPGNTSTGNNPFEHQYRCTKCGATSSSSAIGGPSHCPSCGVKFINGGFDPLGGGSRAPTAKGTGAVFLVVVAVIGVLGLFVLVGVGALIVFLIARSGRRPPVAAAPPARLRPRLVEEGYDA